MRTLLLVLLAGCPAAASEPATDAATNVTCMPRPELAAEACTIALAATPREIAAAADGALYVITANGGLERHVPRSGGCAFDRDASFVAPAGGWRSVEATSDGRVYIAKVEGGMSVLAWLGTSSGMCSDTRAYRPVIGAARDGSVVLAPLTGNGLRRITTSPCGASELAFATTEAVRVLGRFDDGDIVYGSAMNRARVGVDGGVRFREPAAFAGSDQHSLERFGGTIASVEGGALHRVDAESGAALPAVAADAELFDAAPDGSVGYLFGGGCLYKLNP